MNYELKKVGRQSLYKPGFVSLSLSLPRLHEASSAKREKESVCHLSNP